MKIYILLTLVCGGLLWASCDEEKLTSYDGLRFVQFENEVKDSTILSFIFFPGQEYIDLPVVLELVGIASEKDLEYRVTVDQDATTASAGQYSLPQQMLFRSGHYQDTCYVRLKKSADLDHKKVRLVLRIAETSDLQIGKLEKSVKVIRFSNTVDRPDWWNSDIESYYLGKYSDRKYELFIQVTDVYDLTHCDQSEKRAYALALKQYLLEHPTLDEDDQYMEVPVFGLD